MAQAGRSVLLIEAGPDDANAFVRMPAASSNSSAPSVCNSISPSLRPAPGRVVAVPQGGTLGGGSSVNAMIYIRGGSADYDEWRDMGCAGWSWSDVLPVFKRAEANQRLAGPYHGTEGPLVVSDLSFRHPLSLAALRAAQEAGYPYNDDFNGPVQQGVGFYQVTITAEGERSSRRGRLPSSGNGRQPPQGDH
jgi:choline dehydrogenase